MTEQPNIRKSALNAILVEVIVVVLALILYGVATVAPFVANVSIIGISMLLFGVAIVLGIGVGIFLLVLLVEAGKLNVRKVLQFDLEKLATLVLWIILVLGIIFVIAMVVGGGVFSEIQWSALIIGFVGFGITIFMAAIGLLSFLALYQETGAAPAAEKPAN